MGFPTPDSLPSTATSESPVTSTASSSWSPQLGDSFTEIVVRATKNSIPAISSSIQSNNASLRISSQVPGDSASTAPQPFFSSASAVCASVGHYRLELHPPRGSYSLQFHFTRIASSLPSLEYSFASRKLEKAFIVGPGHAPIPSKLVSKIIGGQVVELADLLSANL